MGRCRVDLRQSQKQRTAYRLSYHDLRSLCGTYENRDDLSWSLYVAGRRSCGKAADAASTDNQTSVRTSVPIPKFARVCGLLFANFGIKKEH